MGASSSHSGSRTDSELKLSVPWVPDELCSSCMHCGSPFNVVRRKHHCRCCGGIFCKKCASLFEHLPELGFRKEVRHCTVCVSKKNSRDDLQSRITNAMRRNDVLGLIGLLNKAIEMDREARREALFTVSVPNPMLVQRAKQYLRIQCSKELDSLVAALEAILEEEHGHSNGQGQGQEQDTTEIANTLREGELFIQAIKSLETFSTVDDSSYLPPSYALCVKRLDQVSRYVYLLDISRRRMEAEESLVCTLDRLGGIGSSNSTGTGKTKSRGMRGSFSRALNLNRNRSNSVFAPRPPSTSSVNSNTTTSHDQYLSLQQTITNARVAGVCNQDLLQQAESKLNVLYNLCGGTSTGTGTNTRTVMV